MTNTFGHLRRAQESDFARSCVVASNKRKNKTQGGPGTTSQKRSTALKYVTADARDKHIPNCRHTVY